MMPKPYLKARYWLDRLAALLAVIVLSPVMAVIALLIRRDGGPAIFTQERLGEGARVFHVIKFRTMIVDADKFLDDQGMPTRKRTTDLGDFLRKTSLDEITQLLNIVRGDMAIIGPRPILPNMLPYMTAHERRRFAVKPGVSGLAQVRGRNSIKWSRRFRLDRVYARRAGLLLDIWIIWRTARQVFAGSDIAADRNGAQVDDVRVRKLSS